MTSASLSLRQRNTYTTFTFVRNPLDRFISGYFSSMKWVKMKRHKSCVAALAKAHRSFLGGRREGNIDFLEEGDIDQSAEQPNHPFEPERFFKFTKRFITGSMSQQIDEKGGYSSKHAGVAFPGVQHIFTQASFLSVTSTDGLPLFPRVDFIGRLESFSSDWEKLIKLLSARPRGATRTKLPVVDKIPHRNPSPNGLTELLMGSLLNSTIFLKAVCEFYIQDFLCFGYQLPRGCEPPPKA